VVYAAAARLGLMAEAVAGFATVVWPPSGIALFALATRGRWLWPGVLAGAFAANRWVGAPWPVALGIAAGNAGEAFAAAWLLERTRFEPELERVRDVAALAGAGALVAPLAASVGVASLSLAGLIETPGAAWVTWWLGDSMGVLVVAPALFVWRAPRRAEGASPIEALALAVTLGAACSTVFADWPAGARGDELMFLVFPPLVWAALRFGQPGTTAANLLLSAGAIAGTLAGRGPFADGQGLFELQSFMAVVAALSLALGAAIAERDRARRRALEALGAIEDFVSIAGHELRTPIASLTLTLGGLQKRRGGEPAILSGKKLDRLERQADRLRKLVDDLLDVTRIRAGKLALTRVPVDLAEVAREVVERAGSSAPVVCEDGADTVGSWDRARVAQALGELVDNALRHAGGPVEVRISDIGAAVRVSVRDEGPGIDVERLPQLFLAFGQIAPPERGGMRLGLYLARAFVIAHGGDITVDSRQGAGATFHVDLPR
jgi:signal transduction histidine kinase